MPLLIVALLFGTLLSVCAGLLGAWVTRRILLRGMEVLPSLPSYVEAVEGHDSDAVRFHAAVHDVAMTVTEAWNAAGARHLRPSIEQVIDRTGLAAHGRVLAESAAGLRGGLVDYGDVLARVEAARRGLDEVWGHTKKDHYMTTMVPVVMSNGKGGTTVSMRPQSVYTHTDHTFTLDPGALERAEAALAHLHQARGRRRLPRPQLAQREVLLEEGPEKVLAERLVRMSVVQSMHEVDPETLHQAVNQWLQGAAMDGHIVQVDEVLDAAARQASDVLAASRASQPACSYRTHSSSDPGPPPAQAITALQAHFEHAQTHYQWLLDTLDESEAVANKLVAWAVDPSVVEPDRAYLAQAAKLYGQVFPGSELQLRALPSVGWPLVVGVSVAAVTAGASLGLATVLWVVAWLV